MNTVLSDQMIAQLMSGVTPQVTQSAEASAEAVSLNAGATSLEAPGNSVPGSLEEEVNATAKLSDTGLLGYLQEKVTSLESKTIELSLRAEKAEARLAEVSGLDELLRPIVIEATQRLQVALGQTPTTYSEVPSRALASSYRATLEEFEKRFKPGQRSVQAQDDSKQPKSLAELRLVSSAR